MEKLVNLLLEELLDEISVFLTSLKIDFSCSIFLISDLIINLNLAKKKIQIIVFLTFHKNHYSHYSHDKYM